MTLSSSDGWPLSGPMTRVRRWPLTSRAEHEGQQQQARSRPRPRCTCSGAASGRSGRRSPSVVATISASRAARSSWTSARPSALPKNLADEVLRQPLHQQQARSRRASPTAGSRTWSVRRPARTCATWATNSARDVDERAPCGVVQTELAVSTVGARATTLPSEQRRRRPGRAGGTRASAGAGGSGGSRARGRTAGRRGRGRAHRLGPLEAHPDLADLELVAEAHRGDALDPPAVDVRAVGAGRGPRRTSSGRGRSGRRARPTRTGRR